MKKKKNDNIIPPPPHFFSWWLGQIELCKSFFLPSVARLESVSILRRWRIPGGGSGRGEGRWESPKICHKMESNRL